MVMLSRQCCRVPSSAFRNVCFSLLVGQQFIAIRFFINLLPQMQKMQLTTKTIIMNTRADDVVLLELAYLQNYVRQKIIYVLDY